MKKLLNKIGLGNTALFIWTMIFPSIFLGGLSYFYQWVPLGKDTPIWYFFASLVWGFLWVVIIAIIFIEIFFETFLPKVEKVIKKMNKVKLLSILFILFSFSLTAQSNFYMQDYTCMYQGKQYTMSIGVFDPRTDGSIVVKCEKPNGEWNLKSYDFHSYIPLGYLFVERGNSKRRIIIEKDLYENIISIVFLYSEEKIIYKPIKIVK